MPDTQEKRTKTVQCRITPQQQEALDQIADRQGLSRSDFLLMALSDYVLKVCNEYERQQVAGSLQEFPNG